MTNDTGDVKNTSYTTPAGWEAPAAEAEEGEDEPDEAAVQVVGPAAEAEEGEGRPDEAAV